MNSRPVRSSSRWFWTRIRAFSVVTAWISSGTWLLAVSVTVGRPLASVSNCTVAHAVERERLAPPYEIRSA